LALTLQVYVELRIPILYLPFKWEGLMLRYASLILLVIPISLAFLLPLPANADSTYVINGAMTVPGNSNCPTCSETIDYSFVLEYFPSELAYCNGDGPALSFACVLGTVQTTSMGQMGNNFQAPADDILSPDHGWYLPFVSNGNEIDMTMAFGGPTPIALQSNLHACSGIGCTDFLPNGLDPTASYSFTVANEFTATLIPEPSSVSLGICGILALALLLKIRRNSPRPIS
jgi:hypothetical protein